MQSVFCSGLGLSWSPNALSGKVAQKMTISEFQKFISERYETRDRQRGTPATFMWFIEEVGELATALASNDQKNKEEEFADVFAWLCTLANINDVDLAEAVSKYTSGNCLGHK